MKTPLQDIVLTGGSLSLSPDVLGDTAYIAIMKALQLSSGASLTNCTIQPPQTANSLVVQGTLSSYFDIGSATVTLYLFEVATILGETVRHAVMLFASLPSALDPTTLLKQFCAPTSGGGSAPELSVLQSISFQTGNPYLLYSTLDYTNASLYQNPPFPPADDTSLASDLHKFVSKVQPECTEGYLFLASIFLEPTISFPDPSGDDPETLDIHGVLTTLDLGGLCPSPSNPIPTTVTGQLSFAKAAPQINLLYEFNGASLDKIPLKPSITAVGVGFPLGSGTLQIPILELQGTLTLASSPTQVSMSFQPYYNQLSGLFTDFPDFHDLESNFKVKAPTTVPPLKYILSDFLPSGVIDGLGSFQLLELGCSIDCDALHVDALNFSLVTENPLALFDGISVQPALIVKMTDPFNSYRSTEVDVVGKWFMKSSSLDTVLMVEKDTTSDQEQEQESVTFIANLSIGSGVNFLEVADALFHRQISGLPSLTISDIEIMAQRTGSVDTASDSIGISMDVSSGWNLDGTAIGLDDLSLNINFTKSSPTSSWEIGDVSAQGTLEIGSVFFNLSAEYDPSGKSWTFTGGTVPDESLNLGELLIDISTAVGIGAPPDFLSPFNDVNVTGCYIQYQTNPTGSASWQLTVSTDFTSGNGFNGVILDDIVLNFSRNGTGTSFSFDATTLTPPTQNVSSVITYINSTLELDIPLPASLTDTNIVLRGLSASHDSSAGNYNFVAYLNFGSNALVQLSIDIVSQTLDGTTTKSYILGGNLVLNPGDNEIVFTLELVKSGGVSDMVASLQADTGITIHLGDIVKSIDSSITELDGFAIEIKNALFAHSGANGGNPAKSIFAVDMGAQVNLSKLGNLPIIGGEMASVGSLDIAFQVIYAFGGDYQQTELQSINQELGNPNIKFPEQTVTQGTPVISTSIRTGTGEVIDMQMPIQLNSDNSGNLSSNGGGSITTSNPASTTTNGNNGITWFPLNKTFGPVHVSRVGLAFDKTNMAVIGYLDGGLTLGTITVDLLGLDVNVLLTGDSKFIPTFGLQGLGVNYQNGPIDIGGALFKQNNNGAIEFDGFVTISTESLQIGAIGSFAQMNDGNNSLFVYAVLGEPLGGPAFFFVTGLAAGFGYNRKLLPPALSDVQNFPLITEAMSPAPQPQSGDLSGVHDYVAQQLQLLQKDVVPTAGEYFLAAGIKFTSFRLVEGFLLAIVQFGNELRIDLLGLANTSLPPDSTTDPLAEAQLAIVAHYIPSEGSIWVQGQLTPNSFILSRNCHLTGGFAVACWTSGQYEGQFVTTIGGYAQSFQIPDYFPKPPQVGFNWQVNGNLSLKGGGYFALVPHALMAGGNLQALWESGPVKAWFNMQADFLIAWKPFHYSADIYVDLGAELTIHFFGTHHVSIDASADLEVWGPEFGGHADITVTVIGIHFHFSIDFGASVSVPSALLWDEFQSSFLPSDTSQWLGINIQSGLMRTVQGTLPGTSQEVDVWIVKRDEVNIVTSSVLPVNSVTFTLDGTPASIPTVTPTAGIASMNVSTIQTSTHNISVTKIGSGEVPDSSGQLKITPNTKKVPAGLWGTHFAPTLNPVPGENVLDVVSGFSLIPSSMCNEDPDAITVSRASLAYETDQLNGFTWNSQMETFQGTQSTWSDISTAISTTMTTRQAAIVAMGFVNFRENFNQSLDRDAPISANLGTLTHP